MNQYIDSFTHGVGDVLRHLGSMTTGLSIAQWSVFAVIVIGTGVLFMRGKPVHGS